VLIFEAYGTTPRHLLNRCYPDVPVVTRDAED